MQISNVSYPFYPQKQVFFAGRTPKKVISSTVDKLGLRPSRELLEELINTGLNNQEIATKLKRAVQTIKELRSIYGLPSEHELITQKRKSIVIERLKAGENRKELAKELGVSTGTVNMIAEEFGLFNQYRNDREEKIIQMFETGANRSEIASALNISTDTVRRTLKKFNLSYKPRHREYDAFILEKIKENIPNKQIMKDLNISESPIQRIKKENKLTRVYNRLPKNQAIQWSEIMEESKKVTEIRQDFRRLKQGERNIEVLDHITMTLDALKSKIEEFKARLQPKAD